MLLSGDRCCYILGINPTPVAAQQPRTTNGRRQLHATDKWVQAINRIETTRRRGIIQQQIYEELRNRQAEKLHSSLTIVDMNGSGEEWEDILTFPLTFTQRCRFLRFTLAPPQE